MDLKEAQGRDTDSERNFQHIYDQCNEIRNKTQAVCVEHREYAPGALPEYCGVAGTQQTNPQDFSKSDDGHSLYFTPPVCQFSRNESIFAWNSRESTSSASVVFDIAMLTGFGIDTGDISFAFQNYRRSAGVYCDRSGRDIIWNRICQLDSLLCTIDPPCRYRRHHLWPTGTPLGVFCHPIGHMWLHPVQIPAHQSCYHFLHDS